MGEKNSLSRKQICKFYLYYKKGMIDITGPMTVASNRLYPFKFLTSYIRRSSGSPICKNDGDILLFLAIKFQMYLLSLYRTCESDLFLYTLLTSGSSIGSSIGPNPFLLKQKEYSAKSS